MSAPRHLPNYMSELWTESTRTSESQHAQLLLEILAELKAILAALERRLPDLDDER